MNEGMLQSTSGDIVMLTPLPNSIKIVKMSDNNYISINKLVNTLDKLQCFS